MMIAISFLLMMGGEGVCLELSFFFLFFFYN